jgi:hypothetical protein
MLVMDEEIIFEDINCHHHVDSNQEFFERKDMDSIQLPRFIYSHNNKHRMRWDLIIIFLAIYNCVMIPLSIAMP